MLERLLVRAESSRSDSPRATRCARSNAPRTSKAAFAEPSLTITSSRTAHTGTSTPLPGSASIQRRRPSSCGHSRHLYFSSRAGLAARRTESTEGRNSGVAAVGRLLSCSARRRRGLMLSQRIARAAERLAEDQVRRLDKSEVAKLTKIDVRFAKALASEWLRWKGLVQSAQEGEHQFAKRRHVQDRTALKKAVEEAAAQNEDERLKNSARRILDGTTLLYALTPNTR